MDWKTSLDTTFSDIWRGRNLRRLLTLWLIGLATLALYGTTTNSIPLPEITTDDGSVWPHESQETVARAAPDVTLDSPQTIPLFARVRHIADEIAAIARTLSPTAKTFDRVANACQTSALRRRGAETQSYSLVIDSQEILDAIASSRVWKILSHSVAIQRDGQPENTLASAGRERSVVDGGLDEETGG